MSLHIRAKLTWYITIPSRRLVYGAPGVITPGRCAAVKRRRYELCVVPVSPSGGPLRDDQSFREVDGDIRPMIASIKWSLRALSTLWWKSAASLQFSRQSALVRDASLHLSRTSAERL
jgi:hypothetical protein